MSEDRCDIEIEMTSTGYGWVKINGNVVPQSVTVIAESAVGEPTRLTIAVLPTSIRYVVNDKVQT